MRASPSATRVEPLDRAARRAVLRRLGELAELGAVVVVGLPELVQHPRDLVRVADAVGRELRRDHAVDRPPVGLGQVDEPPEERLVEHARAGVPLERDASRSRPRGRARAARRRGRPPSAPRRRARTAPAARQTAILMLAARAAAMRSSRSSISFSTASLNARWSANAGSTYQRMQPAQDRLQRPALADDRPLGRDRPEPLGLVADREAHLRGRDVGAARPRGADLLLQPREERGDVRRLLGHCAGSVKRRALRLCKRGVRPGRPRASCSSTVAPPTGDGERRARTRPRVAAGRAPVGRAARSAAGSASSSAKTTGIARVARPGPERGHRRRAAPDRAGRGRHPDAPSERRAPVAVGDRRRRSARSRARRPLQPRPAAMLVGEPARSARARAARTAPAARRRRARPRRSAPPTASSAPVDGGASPAERSRSDAAIDDGARRSRARRRARASSAAPPSSTQHDCRPSRARLHDRRPTRARAPIACSGHATSPRPCPRPESAGARAARRQRRTQRSLAERARAPRARCSEVESAYSDARRPHRAGSREDAHRRCDYDRRGGRDRAAHARAGRARRQRDLRARAAARRSRAVGDARLPRARCRRSRPTRAEGLPAEVATEYRRGADDPAAARWRWALAAARPGPLRARLADADVVHYPLTIAHPAVARADAS